MATLRTLALTIALMISAPAAADPRDRWRAEIAEASVRFGVPVAWIEQVMRAESGGRTMLGGRPITSRAGALGLMQVMPATWTAMRVAHGLGGNPHDPHDNILAGTAYLRAMYDRFGYPGLFAAYNAGPGRYAAYLASGRALPTETRAYLVMVSGAPSGSSHVRPERQQATLFITLRTRTKSSDSPPPRAPNALADTVFAIRAPR